jgi:hypothetical protein
MFLREFIYFDRDHAEPVDDNRYISQNDTSVLRKKDLRKTRLTLKMLSEIRRAGEAHDKERQEEMGLIRKMYALPSPEQAAQ